MPDPAVAPAPAVEPPVPPEPPTEPAAPPTEPPAPPTEPPVPPDTPTEPPVSPTEPAFPELPPGPGPTDSPPQAEKARSESTSVETRLSRRAAASMVQAGQR